MRRSLREERSMASTLSHIREIEHVALGDARARDAPLIRPRLRCPNGYRLGPTVAQEA
jgi:hypothetical protein